jgi:hypothetical protein
VTEYLVMIAEQHAASPAEAAARQAAHAEYATRHRDALVDAGRFHARAEGRRVRAGAVEDGSFDGAFDRYYLVRAEGLDAATALVHDLPLGDGDAVELRPLLGGDCDPTKLDRPGKVFAFSVLGAAPDEPAWSELMEHIADDTSDKMPPDRFAGGMRLERPTTGRKIVIDKSKRRVLDGPFLESKEVIGGLFFLAMTSLDEAVRWAEASAFLARGALEIRELWRT